MRERRVRVVPIKKNEPDVDQFVLALLAMLADRHSDDPGVPEPRERRLPAQPDVRAEPGDDAA